MLTDNGVGFSQEANRTNNQFGLGGMQERIKKIGGEFFVKSSPGEGTRVSFDFRIVTVSQGTS